MRSFERRTDRVEQTCGALLAAGGGLGPRAVHAVEVHTLLGERQSGARTIAVLRRFENVVVIEVDAWTPSSHMS